MKLHASGRARRVLSAAACALLVAGCNVGGPKAPVSSAGIADSAASAASSPRTSGTEAVKP